MLMLPLNFFYMLDFNSICNTSIQTNLWTVQPHPAVTVPGIYPELTCNMTGWLNGNGTICHVVNSLQSPVRCHVHTCQWQSWPSGLLTMTLRQCTSEQHHHHLSSLKMFIWTAPPSCIMTPNAHLNSTAIINHHSQCTSEQHHHYISSLKMYIWTAPPSCIMTHNAHLNSTTIIYHHSQCTSEQHHHHISSLKMHIWTALPSYIITQDAQTMHIWRAPPSYIMTHYSWTMHTLSNTNITHDAQTMHCWTVPLSYIITHDVWTMHIWTIVFTHQMNPGLKVKKCIRKC